MPKKSLQVSLLWKGVFTLGLGNFVENNHEKVFWLIYIQLMTVSLKMDLTTNVPLNIFLI